MSDFKQQSVFQAILDSSRLGNLPSVMSHLWVGVLIAWLLPMAQFGSASVDLDWGAIAWSFLGGCLVYVFGTFLGDAYDVEWDRLNKPERPTVTGVISPTVLYGLAFVSLMVGVVAFFKTGRLIEVSVPLGLLVVAIVVYTWIHKKTAWGCVPMGVCRAMLPWIGFQLVAVESMPMVSKVVVFGQCLAGFFYVLGLTFVARNESRPALTDKQKIVPMICFLLPGFWLGFASLPLVLFGIGWGLAGAFLFQGFCFITLKRLQKSVGAFVNQALVGMALIDLPINMAVLTTEFEYKWLCAFPIVAVIVSVVIGTFAKNT